MTEMSGMPEMSLGRYAVSVIRLRVEDVVDIVTLQQRVEVGVETEEVETSVVVHTMEEDKVAVVSGGGSVVVE